MNDIETMISHNVVILDDDEEIGNALSIYLEKRSFTVTTFTDPIKGLKYIQSNPVDVIVVDYLMPKMNGLIFTKLTRVFCQTPILMLTAVHDPVERIVALEIGVNDYMPKPFNPRVLQARIMALLRINKRHDVLACLHPNKQINQSCQFDGWKLNIAKQILLSPKAIAISVSTAEFELLKLLVTNSGTTLSRETIMKMVYGFSDESALRRVDVLIARLRQKMAVNARDTPLIKTVRNVGYIFIPTVKWSTWE